MRLTFHGGTGTVTGANFLLEVFATKNEQPSTRILVDCGLIQGISPAERDPNYDAWAYDPSSVDILIITHAHLDHIGRIPKLVQDGFHGVIYSTAATRDLVGYMLNDAYKVMSQNAIRDGRPLLYDEHFIAQALSLWKTFDYRTKTTLAHGVEAEFFDAGHILGSAMTMLSVTEEGRDMQKILFTGDLGNTPTPLLPDTEATSGAHYIVTESVYGDRNHEGRDMRRALLKEAIERVIRRKGTLLLPAFSLEKTQQILYELNGFIERNEIASVPVFLDSPLAIDVTAVYAKYKGLFNTAVQNEIQAGDDIFKFPKLSMTYGREDSEAIDDTVAPKIILAGSGMSGGGRILRHEVKYLPDPKNMLLLLGYQTLGTLGRKIKDGIRSVEIDGKKVKIRAEVHTVNGYSSHKDSDGLVHNVAQHADTLKKVFCAMGEPKSARFLAQRIRDEVGVEAIAPKLGEVFEI